MGQVRMALNWDAWDTGDQDYDLFVMDRNMNKIVGSDNIQNGPGDDAAADLRLGELRGAQDLVHQLISQLAQQFPGPGHQPTDVQEERRLLLRALEALQPGIREMFCMSARRNRDGK